jgi:DNA-binding NarL/FixJ family response regulator
MMPAIRVFLADDHAVVRDGLRFLLGAHPDITVVGDASNGREAVREIKRLNPDVVIMDIAMPELNGIEAAQQIREACPAAQVIMLSMHASKEHISRALHAGARGFVVKEAAGKEVVDAVFSVHSGHPYLSPRISAAMIDDYLHLRKGAQPKVPLEQLSRREREVLQLVVEGKSSAEVAATLHLSPKTVDTYRSRLMQKLGVADLPALVKFAVRHGLTSPE